MKLRTKKVLNVLASVLFILAVLVFSVSLDKLVGATILSALLLMFWGMVELIYRYKDKQH